MKQEIRERIEKIRKGEVPEGYKKTKVGIIPVEWSVEKIGALTSSASGTTPSREKQNIYYTDGAYLWVKTTDLNNNSLNNTSEKITQRALDETSCKLLPKNTILVAMYGGFNQIGRTGLLTKEAACNQALTGLYPNDNFDSKYLQEVLNLRIFYWKKFAASSRKDPNITRNDVMQFPLPHSNKTEEKKIVEILSTWDKVIEIKEELIKEKKEFKRGLMQKLLSGKMRFIEFNDEWVETRLKKLLIEKDNRNTENQVDLILSVNNKKGFIRQDEQFSKIVASKEVLNYKIIFKGQFAYNPSRINVGSIDLLNTFDKGILSPMYFVFETNDGLNSIYFRYWLDSHQFKGHMNSFISGSVRDSLSFNDLCSMKIKLPQKNEQEKIVELLLLQDNALVSINKQLNQLKEQKKGLMQLLLTGIVRVNI